MGGRGWINPEIRVSLKCYSFTNKVKNSAEDHYKKVQDHRSVYKTLVSILTNNEKSESF